MFKNTIIYFHIILMYILMPLTASEEPKINVLVHIDSWASICSHGSWEDIEKDCLKFKSILEQIQYLAATNSFFEESDEDSSDEENDDDNCEGNGSSEDENGNDYHNNDKKSH